MTTRLTKRDWRTINRALAYRAAAIASFSLWATPPGGPMIAAATLALLGVTIVASVWSIAIMWRAMRRDR